jgi:hypothetical protein
VRFKCFIIHILKEANEMSKIGVALALTVLLLGAVLFIGNKVATQVVDRGGDVGTSLSSVKVSGTDGAVTVTLP